ncbi:hypothetical protein AXG93_1440s1110 [Marchantia polymorpha subsp. ruderalis]|uniref:Uncharacterized protein n=1 Tax=Marchantia polymorpha subsp. ruderalis TaxID=1480154 RepID=A0A176W3L6_MARPO|nr:hypothetical protein AXG93_1440s1110 [Marchantia polymorpha subsp. ruderalis]
MYCALQACAIDWTKAKGDASPVREGRTVGPAGPTARGDACQRARVEGDRAALPRDGALFTSHVICWSVPRIEIRVPLRDAQGPGGGTVAWSPGRPDAWTLRSTKLNLLAAAEFRQATFQASLINSQFDASLAGIGLREHHRERKRESRVASESIGIVELEKAEQALWCVTMELLCGPTPV